MEVCALVLLYFFASSTINGLEILHITLFPKSFKFCLLKPPITPLTSTIMLQLFFSALIPVLIASL